MPAPKPAYAGVTLSSPAASAVLGSPVLVQGSATAPAGRVITAVRIYVDNVSHYFVRSSSFSARLPLSSGRHYIVAQAWDSAGAVYKTPVTITVK